MKQIRQGDILLVAVDKPRPQGLLPKARVVLAKGELTGHAHVLMGEVWEWKVGGQRYVQVGSEHALSHDDHDPAPVKVLEKDITYVVIPQKEWNLEGQWKKVVD